MSDKEIMKYSIYLILALIGFSASAHDEDIPIKYAMELKSWCKSESENHFASIEKTPYNWTASWWSEGNILFVEGMWRVDRKDIVVKCRVVKGADKKYATYELVDKDEL